MGVYASWQQASWRVLDLTQYAGAVRVHEHELILTDHPDKPHAPLADVATVLAGPGVTTSGAALRALADHHVSKENGVWAMVLFDIPVTTPEGQREANDFRKLLRANGFHMHQYSVYVRYAISVAAHQHEHRVIKANLPTNGTVDVFLMSDEQWSRSTRFRGKTPQQQPEAPTQLTIFETENPSDSAS